jgi:hypothetical protein
MNARTKNEPLLGKSSHRRLLEHLGIEYLGGETDGNHKRT